VTPPALERLFGGFYQKLLRMFPEFATRQGDPRYDHLLSDRSPRGHARYEALVRETLGELEQIDRRDISPRDLISYEVLRRGLESRVEGFPFRGHLLGLDHLQGVQLLLPKLLSEMPLETAAGYRRALDRLSCATAHLDGFLETLREGVREGMVQARPVVEKVVAQLDLQLEAPLDTNPYFRPFRPAPARQALAETAKLEGEARRLVEKEVVPALGRFRDYLSQEYLPRARAEAGVWSLKRGEEFYAWSARRSTTTRLEPTEIHSLGMQEVARIRSQMEALRKSLGFQGGLQDFFGYLRRERRFYHETPEEILEEYRGIVRRAEAGLARFFRRLPRARLEVVAVPDYAAASNTTAYYQRPAPDGSRPGYFYANTHDPRSRPRFEMEALTLHEAVPGHHLQLALQMEIEGLPPLRTRWLAFSAFIEGWALYAERLGKEMGFYTDPYSEFGRLIYDMWRACRLVVDTGIHALRWDRARAAAFLTENTALSRLNIESEVDRYLVWPGQALTYKIGELKIRELRERAEKELGGAFDLPAFHDCLLGEGSLPLDLLEARVGAWIGELKKSGRAAEGTGR